MISHAALTPQAPRVCTHPGKRPGSRCAEPVVAVCTLCEEPTCDKHQCEHFQTRPA